jgi:hypothetical protein
MIFRNWSKKPDPGNRSVLPEGTHGPVLLRTGRSVRQSFENLLWCCYSVCKQSHKPLGPWVKSSELLPEQIRIASAEWYHLCFFCLCQSTLDVLPVQESSPTSGCEMHPTMYIRPELLERKTRLTQITWVPPVPHLLAVAFH